MFFNERSTLLEHMRHWRIIDKKDNGYMRRLEGFM